MQRLGGARRARPGARPGAPAPRRRGRGRARRRRRRRRRSPARPGRRLNPLPPSSSAARRRAGRSGGARPGRSSSGRRAPARRSAARECALGLVERDQRGGLPAPSSARASSTSAAADLAGPLRDSSRATAWRAAAAAGRRSVVGGHPGVIGMRRGGFTLRPHPRRGGRVAEGTRLLSEYGAESSIAGSNPALSAPPPAPGRWLHSCHCARSSAG